MSVSAECRFVAQMSLDINDSLGIKNPSMKLPLAREMALSVRDTGVWYGFVVLDSDSGVLVPGKAEKVTVAFFDHVGAVNAFALFSTILYGDGVRTKGTLNLLGQISGSAETCE